MLPVDQSSRLESLNPKKSCLLLAAAGSGKTTILEGRYINCLLNANRPEDVLVLTFTNAAAAEIRNRIVTLLTIAASDIDAGSETVKDVTIRAARELLKRNDQMKWHLLENPQRMRIATFDAYCASLAEKLPVLSGQFSTGQVTEDPSALYRDAILDLFSRIGDKECSEKLRTTLERVLEFSDYRIEGLIPYFSDLLSIRDQWLTELGAIDIEKLEEVIKDYNAGLINALADIVDSPVFSEFVMTVVAASSSSEKLAHFSKYDADSIASGNLDLLKHVANLLLTQKGDYRKKMTAREGFAAKSFAVEVANEFLDFAASKTPASAWASLTASLSISELKESMGHVDDLFYVLTQLVAHLGVRFKEAGEKDFIQVALSAQMSLHTEDGVYGEGMFAEASLQHVLVDEMQDTSISQIRLLKLLTEGWEEHNVENPGFPKTMFLCGDTQQSIYLFRNAEPSIFAELVNSKTFNGISLNVLQLSTNFRSYKATVDFVNAVGSSVFPATPDALTGDAAFLEAVAFSKESGEVNAWTYEVDDQFSEVQHIINRVRDLQAKSEGSIAILTTTRGAIAELMTELPKAGISVNGCDIHPIQNKPIVSTVYSLIRALWHESDEVNWMAVLRSPVIAMPRNDVSAIFKFKNANGGSILSALGCADEIEGLSDDGKHRSTYLYRIVKNAIGQRELASDISKLARHTWAFLKGYSFFNSADGNDARRVFDVLASVTRSGAISNLDAFERKIGRLFASSGTTNRVQVMTIHKSKGLEFDHVILTGLGHGIPSESGGIADFLRIGGVLLPAVKPQSGESGIYNFIKNIKKKKRANELKRLFYVATTRQKETLDLYIPVVATDDGLKVKSNTMISSVFDAVNNAVKTKHLDRSLFSAVEADEVRELVISSPALKHLKIRPLIEVVSKADDLNHAEMKMSEVWRAAEGTVIHKLIELALKGKTEGADLVGFAKGLLKRSGYPADHIEKGARFAVDQADRILNAQYFKDLSADSINIKSEAKFTFLGNGRVVNRYIDILLETETCVWILDIKSDSCNTGEEAFKQELVAKYGEKMDQYRRLVSQTTNKAVKTALLSTSLDTMIEIEAEAKAA